MTIEEKIAIQKNVCPECNNKTNMINDDSRGELICGNCGLVIKEKIIDQGPEWRAFNSLEKKKKTRVGPPPLFTINDKGLSTVIDWHNKDIHGKKLSPKSQRRIYRMRKWQYRSRIHDSIARNLAQAMRELDRLTSQLDIPNGVKKTAAVLYRNALKKKLIRGRSINAMIAATLYAACRLRKVPRTLDEISKHSRQNKKDIGRSFRLFIQQMDIKIPISNAKDYIPRFCTDLKLSYRVQKKTAKIIDMAINKSITSGKDPTGIAAAAIYIAAILEGERKSQREIADVTHLTEVTIRNRYKELIKKLKILLEV
ncbi:MAG: transcription initiation factor IIB [Candidatus Hodarchaeota archaeon]